MKTAGCILLLLSGLVIVIGFAVSFLAGKSAVEETMEKPETVKELALQVGEEGTLEDVHLRSSDTEPAIFFAIVELKISSPETETVHLQDGRTVPRPKFRVPYSLTVVEQDGTVRNQDQGEITASTQTFQWVETGAQVDDNTASEMTVSPSVPIAQQNNNQQQALDLTVDVRGSVSEDAEGKARIESAKLVVVKKSIPAMAFLGAGLGFIGAFCIGGTLGVIGLILFIIGLSSKK